MDALTVVTVISLCISEILPLVHNTSANGILHFLLVICKDLLEVIDKKEPSTPSVSNDGAAVLHG